MSKHLEYLAALVKMHRPDSEEHQQALSHFAIMERKMEQRQITMELHIEPSRIDAIKADLTKFMQAEFTKNGFVKPAEGSEWVSIDDERKPKHREGVIVTDGRTWGISSYNEYRAKGGTPFPVIYDVCEWDVMDTITHWRSMDAVTLPNGRLMAEPKAMVLERGYNTCGECANPLEWHQVCGMRLTEEIDGVTVYKARCTKCGVTQWVKK
jgi:hypothetical protein